jgi:hypothetical protein
MELILILGGFAVAGAVVGYFVYKSKQPDAPPASAEVVAEAKALRDRLTQNPPPPEAKK